MLNSIALLAELGLNFEDSLPKSGGLFQKGSGSDVFLIIGIGLALALLLFLIAYLAKGRRTRRRGLARSPRLVYKDTGGSPERSNGKVRRRRRSHPDNLPRNPTLGETGGLPPLRPDNPSEPLA